MFPGYSLIVSAYSYICKPPEEATKENSTNAIAKARFSKPFTYDISHMPLKAVQAQSYGAIAVAMAVLDTQNLFKRLLTVPQVVRNIILENLSIKDLNSLELVNKLELSDLIKDIQHIRSKKIFNEMLEMFPKPAPINFNSWPELKDDEKIWLLSIFCLEQLGVDFSKYKGLQRKEIVAKKNEIQVFLDTIEKLELEGFHFIEKCKFPDVIRLLKNLKKVYLFGEKMDLDTLIILHDDGSNSAQVKAENERRSKAYNFYWFKTEQYPKIQFF